MKIKTPTLDKVKIYEATLKLCWATIIICTILKFFGFNEFQFPEYTYNINPWIRRIINFILYEINTICYLLVLIKRKPKVKEILLAIGLAVMPFTLSLFIITVNFKIIAEVIIYFILGIICLKDKWYRVLLESVLVSLIFIAYQRITMLYKNINPHILVTYNFVADKLLSVDLYMLLIITILYNFKKGGYIYDRWFKFLVLLPKRIFSKKSLQQNQKPIQKVKDETNEIGFKIFIVVLSIFQFTLVGTVCYFVNNVVLEYVIITISFFILRPIFGKSYHADRVIKCTTLAMVVFTTVTRLALPLEITVLFNVFLGLIVAYMMRVMYYYMKYTSSEGITIERGMTKANLDLVCTGKDLTLLEKEILTDFYCNKFKIPKIAMKYHYSVDSINKIKAKALEKIRH